MKRAGIACLIAAASFAVSGAALANNECSNGAYNIIFKVANETSYDFAAQIDKVQSTVTNPEMPDLAAETTGWNACFWVNGEVDGSVSVDYSNDDSKLKFSVVYEVTFDDGNPVKAAEASGYGGSPVTVSFDGDDTLTISDAN